MRTLPEESSRALKAPTRTPRKAESSQESLCGKPRRLYRAYPASHGRCEIPLLQTFLALLARYPTSAHGHSLVIPVKAHMGKVLIWGTGRGRLRGKGGGCDVYLHCCFHCYWCSPIRLTSPDWSRLTKRSTNSDKTACRNAGFTIPIVVATAPAANGDVAPK